MYKTAGIRLFALGAGPVAGTSYILGVNRAGGLSLFKNTNEYVDLICSFDENGIDLNITPTSNEHVVNKRYIDTRYVVPLISIVPYLTSNSGNKTWAVSASSELNSNWGAYNAFNGTGSEWAINGSSPFIGSGASITVASTYSFVLGGFGIAGRISTNSNSLPSSWTIGGANNTIGPYTTLYTGTSTITVLFEIIYIDFRSITDSIGNPSSFKYFRYQGISGGTGDWGMAKFELYPAVPIS